MTSSVKILFVSHDSTSTGAPILLLQLVGLFREKGYEVSVLLMRGGEIEREFGRIAKTFILKETDYHKRASYPRRVVQYIQYRFRRSHILRLLKNVDVVWSNTVCNGFIVEHFSKRGIPVIAYVHELESVIRQFSISARQTFRYASTIVTPSTVVSNNLIENHGVDRSRVRHLPYYLPFSPAIGLQGGNLFRQFPIPKSRIYVVGMGTANYRKGFDMFVEIAKLTWQRDKEFHFTWIGGFVDTEMDAWYRSAQSAEMSKFFLITGTMPRNLELLKGMDIFLLTSREDPYPLVVIEAAQMSLPSIYFAGAGGIGDFVGSECGWPIAGFSISKVVDLLLSLKENRAELVEKGNNAKFKAQRIHEDGAGIINKCFEFINELI